MRLHVVDQMIAAEQLERLAAQLIAHRFPVDGQIIFVRGRRTLCLGQAGPLTGVFRRQPPREVFNEGL
jgi:hypothetical protein